MSPHGPDWSLEAQVRRECLQRVGVPLDHVIVFRADVWHAGGPYCSNMARMHGYGVPHWEGRRVPVPGEVYGAPRDE